MFIGRETIATSGTCNDIAIQKNDIGYACVGLWPIDFRNTT
jgi:hypothetical protein